MTGFLNNQIEGVAKDLIEWVKSQGGKQEDRGSLSQTAVWLIISAISFVIIGYLHYQLGQKGKQLAALQHEKDVAAEQKRQAEENKLLEANKAIRQQLSDDIRANDIEIQVLDLQLKELETKRNKIHEDLQAVRNWNDLDNLRSNKPN